MARRKQADIIQGLTDRELIFHLLLTQFILLFIAVIVGWFLFKDAASFMEHFRIDSSIGTYGLTSGILVVILDSILMKVLPKAYYDDGGVNERIFRRLTVPEIFFITMLVAFSEEILFRGVIQSCFGLIAASLIFAAVHIRYWRHWYLIVNVVILSLWLGLVYDLSHENLLSTMMMHFTIDFILGIRIKKWGT